MTRHLIPLAALALAGCAALPTPEAARDYARLAAYLAAETGYEPRVFTPEDIDAYRAQCAAEAVIAVAERDETLRRVCAFLED